jgi:hypothetical protein
MKGIIRKGSKAEERLRVISEDLQKKIETGKIGKMSPGDILSACNIGKELVARGVTQTVIKNVADYFKSFGFIVTMDFHNVNYVIVA